VIPAAPTSAAWAFVLGGLLSATGAGLRWFAPGHTIDERLDDRLSPLLPRFPEATVPGSIALTAAGLAVVALAWALLALTAERGGRRWWLVASCAWCAAGALYVGVPTARAALTGTPAGALDDVWSVVFFPAFLGLPQVVVALLLLARRTAPRLVAAGALLVTAPFLEFLLLSLVYPSHDDPGGFGVLSGVGFVVAGLALLVDRVRGGRADSPSALPARAPRVAV